MTVAGKTAQPLQPAAPFARWSAVLAAGLGCLALAVVAATFPLGSMAGQQNAQTVAAALVALAFAAVGLLVALRQPRNPMGWLLLAGGLLVALSPVRRRVQHGVDRRFNRARYDADLIVAAFAPRLQDTADPDATTLDLGVTVQRALEPAHLALWITDVAS
jgi:hypothetical protein